MDSPKNFNQGALPCPVFTRQRKDTPGMKPQIDTAQDLNGPKTMTGGTELDPGLISFNLRALLASLGSPDCAGFTLYDTGAATPQLHPPRPP